MPAGSVLCGDFVFAIMLVMRCGRRILLDRVNATKPAGYGASTEFRDQLTAMGFTYVVGVTGAVSLQSQALAPLRAKELAMQLPSRRFRTLTWREGTNCALSSRFAAIRVHCASRAARPGETSAEQWLLIEWPKAEVEPTKYFLSTLPADTPIKELVRLAKLRWRIERKRSIFDVYQLTL